MILKKIEIKPGNAYRTNCYIIADDETKEAMVVDPGGEPEKILQMIDVLEVNVKYIVLTHSGTALSKIIKGFTKDEFSHVSISLDKELNEMYSFGRLNPYNPFWGGFVHEYIDKGTFKRFYKTRSKIYSLNITEEQYEYKKNIIFIVLNL